MGDIDGLLPLCEIPHGYLYLLGDTNGYFNLFPSMRDALSYEPL